MDMNLASRRSPRITFSHGNGTEPMVPSRFTYNRQATQPPPTDAAQYLPEGCLMPMTKPPWWFRMRRVYYPVSSILHVVMFAAIIALSVEIPTIGVPLIQTIRQLKQCESGDERRGGGGGGGSSMAVEMRSALPVGSGGWNVGDFVSVDYAGAAHRGALLRVPQLPPQPPLTPTATNTTAGNTTTTIMRGQFEQAVQESIQRRLTRGSLKDETLCEAMFRHVNRVGRQLHSALLLQNTTNNTMEGVDERSCPSLQSQLRLTSARMGFGMAARSREELTIGSFSKSGDEEDHGLEEDDEDQRSSMTQWGIAACQASFEWDATTSTSVSEEKQQRSTTTTKHHPTVLFDTPTSVSLFRFTFLHLGRCTAARGSRTISHTKSSTQSRSLRNDIDEPIATFQWSTWTLVHEEAKWVCVEVQVISQSALQEVRNASSTFFHGEDSIVESFDVIPGTFVWTSNSTSSSTITTNSPVEDSMDNTIGGNSEASWNMFSKLRRPLGGGSPMMISSAGRGGGSSTFLAVSSRSMMAAHRSDPDGDPQHQKEEDRVLWEQDDALRSMEEAWHRVAPPPSGASSSRELFLRRRSEPHSSSMSLTLTMVHFAWDRNGSSYWRSAEVDASWGSLSSPLCPLSAFRDATSGGLSSYPEPGLFRVAWSPSERGAGSSSGTRSRIFALQCSHHVTVLDYQWALLPSAVEGGSSSSSFRLQCTVRRVATTVSLFSSTVLHSTPISLLAVTAMLPPFSSQGTSVSSAARSIALLFELPDPSTNDEGDNGPVSLHQFLQSDSSSFLRPRAPLETRIGIVRCDVPPSTSNLTFADVDVEGSFSMILHPPALAMLHYAKQSWTALQQRDPDFVAYFAQHSMTPSGKVSSYHWVRLALIMSDLRHTAVASHSTIATATTTATAMSLRLRNVAPVAVDQTAMVTLPVEWVGGSRMVGVAQFATRDGASEVRVQLGGLVQLKNTLTPIQVGAWRSSAAAFAHAPESQTLRVGALYRYGGLQLGETVQHWLLEEPRSSALQGSTLTDGFIGRCTAPNTLVLQQG